MYCICLFRDCYHIYDDTICRLVSCDFPPLAPPLSLEIVNPATGFVNGNGCLGVFHVHVRV